ncbi:MAG: hypothetical protein PHN42_05290 [Bacilli bacterium]|nr:hypothetical protein [Bacilli bacterium]
MKIIKTIFVFLSLFIFQTNVSAATMNDFMIESDKIDYNNNEEVTLKIKMNKDLNLDMNETFYYIIYDDQIFDFVSFNGIDNVLYDFESQKLYLTKNILVKAEDIIGTLKIKIKEDAVNIKTNVDINYYSFYKTKDNEDKIELTISPIITIDKDDDIEEVVENKSDFNPYLIGGIGTLSIALLSFIIYAIKKA